MNNTDKIFDDIFEIVLLEKIKTVVNEEEDVVTFDELFDKIILPILEKYKVKEGIIDI